MASRTCSHTMSSCRLPSGRLDWPHQSTKKCEPVVRAPLEAERPLRPDAPALPGPMSDGARQRPSGLLFSCPKSGRQVPTGIETDVQSLRALWRRKLKLDCPHCGEVHEFSVREAYLNSALKDANDRTM
jgi:hypothetical protein